MSIKSYYIFEQRTPLGEFYPLRLEPCVGYRWIRLDLQVPKISVALRISGPDQRGRRRGANRFPENLIPDIPRDSFLEAVFETKVDQYDHTGNLKVFLDSQDHPYHHGSLQQVTGGPEPGHPQGLNYFGFFLNQSCQV